MSPTLEYFMSMPHWLDALTPPLQDHLDRLAVTTRLILERAGVSLATPPAEQASLPPPVRPLTPSREIARGIGRWVTGGTESPTLVEVFVPRSDKVATTAVIGASVIAISLLAQVRIGPIWLQPLAVLLTGPFWGVEGRSGGDSLCCSRNLGLPVFAPGVNAWTNVDYRAPYVRYALGYLMGLTAAAFAVGWLTERRSWDRHRANAARLALVGIVLLYLPGVIWLEGAVADARSTQASGCAAVDPYARYHRGCFGVRSATRLGRGGGDAARSGDVQVAGQGGSKLPEE